MMQQKDSILSKAWIEQYASYLREQERAPATVQKYVRDLWALMNFLDGGALTKEAMVCWKQHLASRYAPSTVNSMLAAANHFLAYINRRELTVRPLKLQKTLFYREEKEPSREEYVRLVRAAQRQGNERLALVLQTICATGIRVSELRDITVEALDRGRAEITSKGKRRIVFLPEKLRRILKRYVRSQNKGTGAVFTSRTGKPLDRSNIWRDMKALCRSAGVDPQKVFPHNLRHLFARTFYAQERDLSRLADLLGHSDLSTTRIYTAESGAVHARQVERLGLMIT